LLGIFFIIGWSERPRPGSLSKKGEKKLPYTGKFHLLYNKKMTSSSSPPPPPFYCPTKPEQKSNNRPNLDDVSDLVAVVAGGLVTVLGTVPRNMTRT
jgi:hypothetical protein